MRYRDPFGGKKVFADWLVSLRDKSGAYVIRKSGRVVYVGESHTGNLAQTIRRHFQSWDDGGGREHFTTDRDGVTVGVVVTASTRAVDVQNALIRRFQPEGNKAGVARPGLLDDWTPF